MNRKQREKAVVAKMIAIYCRRHHHYGGTLCPECAELFAYVCRRIDACPLGAEKTSCRKCPIHCYQPNYRWQIREVMRYAGPRMIYLAPLTALRHLLSELRSR